MRMLVYARYHLRPRRRRPRTLFSQLATTQSRRDDDPLRKGDSLHGGRLVMDSKSLRPRIETINEEFATRSARLVARASPLDSARVSLSSSDFLSPYREAVERVRTKGRADCDVRRIATASDQYSADAWDVVARVKRVPLAADIGFEPGCEIHRCVRDRHADIAQITGAVSRRDVHAATEGDREVSIVPADAGAIAEGFPSRPAGTRMFIAEGNVLVNEVADGLDATPAERRLPEQRPCDLGKPIGLAIAAGQQEHQ